MDCKVCRSLSGEKRISPGPPIFEGKHWVVEHAYPTKLKGWLVLVLKRHVEALHFLTLTEQVELVAILERTVRLLHTHIGCRKEYVFCLGEAEGFQHLHLHIVPRLENMPDDATGIKVFSLLKVSAGQAHPPKIINTLCRHLKEHF